MLADNIVILKKKMPELYQQMKDWENRRSEVTYFIEKAKDNYPTLRYERDNTRLYIHSKYNPLKEAEAIVKKIEPDELGEKTHVVFYGIGLGYHIDSFVKQYPEITFSIIEPSYEIMHHYLNVSKIADLFKRRLIDIYVGEDYGLFFESVKYRKDKQLKIIELPVYPKLFSEEYLKFLHEFNEALKLEKIALVINLTTEKRWIKNCVNNFRTVLETPNILLEHNDVFAKKTAILVAAGPSLNDEIENLRKIKNEGLAYIFAVGSAINTLIHNNIYPDAMCTYDPHVENQEVFKKINELEIRSIPMIFGSSVGFETLEQYKGLMLHMIMNIDTVAAYFLQTRTSKEIECIQDAPTIAAVTLQLLGKLGFEKIILVGQNLAYINDKYYADGISYSFSQEKATKKIEVEDVEGNQVETSESFQNMRKYLESVIAAINARVINATKGGAKIEGACFKPLDQLINGDLSKKIVQGGELNKLTRINVYDKEFLQQQMKELRITYATYNQLLIEIKQYLNRLNSLFKSNNKQEIIDTHIRMNYKIVEIENNDFFNIFARNLNRVAYKKAMDRTEAVKKDKSQVSQIKKCYEPVNGLIDLLLFEHEIDELLLKELDEVISSYKECN